ncbi:MAG: SulP family inorganic anion transporter [Methyloceanibacter sp.]
MQEAKSKRPELGLSRWIPALHWLPAYDRSWWWGDLVAGITLAAYLLPAALGDASLANLPPEAGLYGGRLEVNQEFWLLLHPTWRQASAVAFP